MKMIYTNLEVQQMLQRRLRSLRESRGLSQEKVGKLFDLSPMAVSSWESGSI